MYGPLPLVITGPARIYGFDIDNMRSTPARVRLRRTEGSVLVDCFVPPHHAHGPAFYELPEFQHLPSWFWDAGFDGEIYVPNGASVRLEAVDSEQVDLVGNLNYADLASARPAEAAEQQDQDDNDQN